MPEIIKPGQQKETVCAAPAYKPDRNGNPEQRKAIVHGAGPMMVLAGPGSGKTFVLTRRIAHLINAHHIPPSEILVITFTRAAAGEMQQRFLKLCDGHPPVTFGTFHAVFYAILKETSLCRTGSILSEPEKKKLLRDIIRKNHYNISTNTDMLEELLAQIGRCKNRQDTASGNTDEEHFPISSHIEQDLFRNLYRDYREAQEITGKVDFDDMAFKCEELFWKRPDILKRYQQRYRYLLIDEFQDIAPMQYRLVRMLAEPENNLFIVGDDDQSIYGFRGARPDIMLNFPKDYPRAQTVTLQVNYRSTPQIVQAASCLISHNEKRFFKESRAENAAGKPIVTEKCVSSEMQEKMLVKALLKEKTDGNLENCAVICRTGGRFPLLAEKLRQAGISCNFREKQKSIFEHEMVNDLFSYLEFAHTKPGNRSRAQFFRFMNRPLRYISREAVNEKADFSEMIRFYRGRPAMQEMILRLQADLERIGKMPVFLAVNVIRKTMGYDNYLREQYGKDSMADSAGVLELADLIQNSARDCKTPGQWKMVIEECVNREKEKNKPKGEENREKGVSLLTMHGSKGLEYDKVFMLGCNEGITPHRKARSKEETEEERRMFYVGMTRAKKELTFLYVDDTGESAKNDGAARAMPPSRFLKEIKAPANLSVKEAEKEKAYS